MKKLLSLLAAAGICLSGCSDSVRTPAEHNRADQKHYSITVGLTYIPNIQFSPLYVAEKEGYFRDFGLDVTLRHHGAQEALFGALSSGAEDIVFAGADEMMQARDSGVDVVNWATMYQNYPVALISPKSAGIKSWADLKGRRIGVPGPYGENYFGLQSALRAHHLEKEVTVEYIGYTQAAALKEKKVDAVIGFVNNDAVALEKAGMEVDLLPIADKKEPNLIGVGFGSKRSRIRVQVYAKFLKAVEKAVRKAHSDPQAALTATEKYVPSVKDPQTAEMTKEILRRTLELYRGSGIFGRQDCGAWERMSHFLKEAGLVKKTVPAREAFTRSVTEAARKL